MISACRLNYFPSIVQTYDMHTSIRKNSSFMRAYLLDVSLNFGLVRDMSQ